MKETYIEKTKKEGKEPFDRQNTRWYTEISRNCEHKWQPVQMVLEKADRSIPDIVKGRCYCVCMKCMGHTWIETGYVGYYIGSPDLLEEK